MPVLNCLSISMHHTPFSPIRSMCGLAYNKYAKVLPMTRRLYDPTKNTDCEEVILKVSTSLYNKPERFIPLFHSALQATLPGVPAQLKMAPPHHEIHPQPQVIPRQSAVLILLHMTAQGIAIPLTRRSLNLNHHRGQICLPGGRLENSDASYVAAALRETEEELGIPTSDVQILGKMTPLYIRVSQNLVHPVIGWLSNLPHLQPNPFEVDEILIIPLQKLVEPEAVKTYTIPQRTPPTFAPCFSVGGTCIWGATAMMLSEFVEIIKAIAPLSQQDHTA